jgi:hypothetical protein
LRDANAEQLSSFRDKAKAGFRGGSAFFCEFQIETNTKIIYKNHLVVGAMLAKSAKIGHLFSVTVFDSSRFSFPGF